MTDPQGERPDSRLETEAHIERVRELLYHCIDLLKDRATNHDATKLVSPEKEAFDKATAKLRGLTYGSDDYKKALADLGPALRHHYDHNSHHPQHYPNGIYGMTLLDLIEMLCDWQASGERHKDGGMMESLAVNQDRFNIDHTLYVILENSALEMGFL